MRAQADPGWKLGPLDVRQDSPIDLIPYDRLSECSKCSTDNRHGGLVQDWTGWDIRGSPQIGG